MTHPEIAREQAHLDRAHERLDSMREAARAIASEVLVLGAGGTFANRLERDVRVEMAERRLAQLRVGDGSVCFGRLDMSNGERFYIGRIGILDEDGDPLVVDWRAPVAEPFYRATPAERFGVVRRRHFVFRGRTLTGIDDELLDSAAPGAGGLVLMGEAALIAGLERGRSGRMADIVSTIQAEQDAVIRADLAGPLVVQGGAGTGKTAVALHRAAYLLYTHRLRLEREGMLVVGPNLVFLRYIDQVLPSLGEHSVTLATPDDLYAGDGGAISPESIEVATLKGDARMATVVRQAVETRQRRLRRPLVVELSGQEVRLEVGETDRLVGAAKALPGAHNARRAVLERRLARVLLRGWRRAASAAAEGGRRARVSDDEIAEVAEELESGLRRLPAVREALETMWPVLSPEELLNDLFGTPALLRRAGAGALDETEVELLRRARSPDVAGIAWSAADRALLDEAAALLGPVSAARPDRSKRRPLSEDEAFMLDRALDDQLPDCPGCGAQLVFEPRGQKWHCERCGRNWAGEAVMTSAEELTLSQVRARVAGSFAAATDRLVRKGARYYGHAVVDEAQAMTAMGWRALARRVPSGSFTIVGDLGQAIGPAAPQSWGQIVAALSERRRPRMAELTVNYRTPEEIMALASPVLLEASPSLSPPRSARRAGESPVVSRVAGNGSGKPVEEVAVARAVVQAASDERRRSLDGRVAVIAPDAMLGTLAARLEVPRSGAGAVSTAEADRLLAAPVGVFGVGAARGLEFDAVVLVEPSQIAAEERRGLRAVYVAITRATRRLHIVHAAELPGPLLAAVAALGAPSGDEQ